MEDRGGQHRIGFPLLKRVAQMPQIARATRGDHRDRHRIADRASQRQIITLSGAVAVHRSQQDLSGSPVGRFLRPPNHVPSGGRASPVYVDLPPGTAGPFRVNCHHDALAPEMPGPFGDQRRPFDRSGIDRHLITSLSHQAPDLFKRADPAPHRERNKQRPGNGPRQLDPGGAGFRRSGDVEEYQLVGTLLLVAMGRLNRVAGVFQVPEADPLDDAPGFDVETGDDPFGEHASMALFKSSFPS